MLGINYIGVSIPENYKPFIERYDTILDFIRDAIELSHDFLIYSRIKTDDIDGEVVLYKGCLLDARIVVNGEELRGIRAWAVLEDLGEKGSVEAVIYRLKPVSID